MQGDKSHFNKSHIAHGSGFIPCPYCCEKTAHMNKPQFCEWLGRNPWRTRTARNETLRNALARTFEERFILIARKYRFSLEMHRHHKRQDIINFSTQPRMTKRTREASS
jgi:hypothetical protein